MNKLTIPPSPNWYETSIMSCAPDNTLVYGSRTDIVVVKPGIGNEPADVKIISKAHSKKIVSVNLNQRWTDSCKLCVTVSEDTLVKVWDLEKLERKAVQDGHLKHIERVVGAAFAGNERVISVSENGFIIIWHINNNELTEFKELFGYKVTITCLSVCPHATWLVAFGLKNGLVYVTDLRKKGKILYRLRGHEKSVLSLTWCPAPINVFPKNPRNIITPIHTKSSVSEKTEENRNVTTSSVPDTLQSNEICSTEEAENVTVTQEVKVKVKKNPWVDLKHADDDEVPPDYAYSGREQPKPLDFGDEDFLSECLSLKSKILNGQDDENSGKTSTNLDDCVHSTSQAERKILKTKKKTKDKKMNDHKNKLTHCVESEHKDNVTSGNEKDGNNLTAQNEEKTNDSSGNKNVNNLTVESEEKTNDSSTNENTQNYENTNDSSSDKNVNNLTVESEEKTNDSSSNENTQNYEKTNDSSSDKNVNDLTVKSEEKTNDSSFDENVNSLTVECEEKTAAGEKGSESKDLGEIDLKNENEDKPTLDETTGEKNISGNNNLTAEIEERTSASENRILTRPEDKKGVEKDFLAGDGDSRDKTGSENLLEKTVDEKGDAVEEYTLHPTHVYIPAPEEETPRKEFLLASSGRDSNIYIWRAGTDGRMQTFLSVGGKSHKGKSKQSTDKIFITVNWISPNVLLSSSKSGELVEWTLPRPIDTKCPQPRLIHNDHQGCLFCIAGPVEILTSANFQAEHKLNVWTTGIDRLLLNTSIDSQRTNLANYRTLGGAVHCFASSPFDPSRFALGVSEGVILLWDLSRPHVNHINLTRYYHYIRSKVTALIWNPSKEFELVYATFEGRIGVVDTSKLNKEPTLLPNIFRSQVHNIEFGPLNGKVDELGLYVIGEGKLMIFDLKHPKKDPVHLSMPRDSMFSYSFSWKPDYSYLMVTTKTGEVNLYSTDLKLVKTFYLGQKGLAHILWHPDASASGLPGSNWIACSVNGENDFTVYDFSVLLSGDNEDPKRVVGTFEGHIEYINSLAWCPFDGNKIVSAGADGVAHVWDVTTKQIISTFVESNLDVIYSCIWSPLNEDYIISSGRTNSVTIWKISENPPKNDKKFIAERAKQIKTIKRECQSLLPKSEKVKTQEKLKKTSIFDGNSMFADKGLSMQLENMRKLLSIKECEKNNDVDVKSDENEEGSLFIKLFGNRDDMLELMSMTIDGHKERRNHNMCMATSLFSGENIAENVKTAIEEKRVTPQILSIATMISPALWREACECYASQLSLLNSADPTEAATYYLACHKVEEAISVLCSNCLFKEALAIAKCRLAPEDPTINKILVDWAKDATYNGLFEIAAQCYIVLGSYEEAAKVLFRRSDESLKFALELAELTGNQELQEAISFRCKAFTTPNNLTEAEKPLPSKIDAVINYENESLEAVKNKVVSSATSETDINLNLSNNNNNIENNVCDSSSEVLSESKSTMNVNAPEFISALKNVENNKE